MAVERALIYKNVEGEVILLRFEPMRKVLFTLTDDIYKDLAFDKADVVELDDNEVIQMTNIRPIRGVTFTGRQDEPVASHEAIEYALASNPQALAEMLVSATEDKI